MDLFFSSPPQIAPNEAIIFLPAQGHPAMLNGPRVPFRRPLRGHNKFIL